MNVKIIPVLLFVILIYGLGCQNQNINSQDIENQKPIFDAESQKYVSDESVKYIDLLDLRVGKNALTYEDYKLEKQFKSHPDLADKAKTVEYAILHKGNKKVEKFDLLEHPLSVVDFGWFSFSGKNQKQIFISQTAPRSGNHWIISFEPKYLILFNSSEFDVYGENFHIVDLDKDGVYELSFAKYISLKLNSEILKESVPSTEVIFKFNQKLNKYLPANPQFANYLLRDVAEQTKLIKRENRDIRFADVLNIALKYIFAGKEKEAWDFFEKQYDFEDKETRKSAVKHALEKDIIYKSFKKVYD